MRTVRVSRGLNLGLARDFLGQEVNFLQSVPEERAHLPEDEVQGRTLLQVLDQEFLSLEDDLVEDPLVVREGTVDGPSAGDVRGVAVVLAAWKNSFLRLVGGYIDAYSDTDQRPSGPCPRPSSTDCS